MWLLKCFVFQIWRFLRFLQKFSGLELSKFFRPFKFTRYDLFMVFSWLMSGYSQRLQIWLPNLTTHILLVFKIWRFNDFQMFSENLKAGKFSLKLLPLSWVISGFQIMPPKLTAQMLSFSEIWLFLKIFWKFYRIGNWLPIVWCFQGSLRGCKFSFQIWPLTTS